MSLTTRAKKPGLLIGVSMIGGLVGSSCGGSSSNGIAGDSAQQIVSRALAAMKTASSVTISGVVTRSGATLNVYFTVFSNGDVSGSFRTGGKVTAVVIAHNRDYVKGPAAFWASSGFVSSAAAKLAGKWVVSAPSQLALASGFSMVTIESSLAPSNVGTLTKGRQQDVDNQPAITVTSSNQGTIWVATTGTPYPVGLQGGTATSGGALAFGNWDKGSLPSVPAGARSASSILGSGA